VPPRLPDPPCPPPDAPAFHPSPLPAAALHGKRCACKSQNIFHSSELRCQPDQSQYCGHHKKFREEIVAEQKCDCSTVSNTAMQIASPISGIGLLIFHMGTWEISLGEAKQRNLYTSWDNRHTGDAPSNQPYVAGVVPQRNVGLEVSLSRIHEASQVRPPETSNSSRWCSESADVRRMPCQTWNKTVASSVLPPTFPHGTLSRTLQVH